MTISTKTDGQILAGRMSSSPDGESNLKDAALAAVADWVWETDGDLRLTRLSPIFADGAGLPCGTDVGMTLEDALLRGQMDSAALAAHAPFRGLRLQLWDERESRMRHFLMSGRPCFAPVGVFIGYRGTGSDCTAEVERQCHDSRCRLQTVFDHTALGVAVIGRGGRIERANPALAAMVRMTPTELVGRLFADLTHPEDRDRDADAASRLLRRETGDYTRESRYLRRDGSSFWGRLSMSVVPPDGQLAVAMIEDIDNGKRAEANLSLFRSVMDAAHEAIAILSPSGHILYANQAYGKLFDIPAGEVHGSHYRSYFTPASHEILDRVVGPALVRGESWEGVLDAQLGSGRKFPLWQRSGALRDDLGRVRFYFAFMHDHSDQQMFEDDLYGAKEAAEEAAVAKTRFLAAASHDLRQPMQALAMFVAVLAGKARESELSGLVGRIQDSVTALEGLLNSLLDVSKLEAGLVVPVTEEFAARGLMERLASEFVPLCEIEGLGFDVVPSRLVVQSDPSLLERILRNLLNNAVRYTKTGRVLFGCRRAGKMLRFEVCDTGIGIPKAELKNIFREFHQVGNPGRDRRQGLGLGLAIVERLADLLGHRIVVRSVEGKGSVFAVEVPLAVRPTPHNKPRQLPLGLSQAGATVIVIDDEPDVREGLELLLESWGHRVVSAASAEDAIQRLPSLGRDPELILADYRLQNGDTGGQAIARVEAHLRADLRVPAIILTGDTAPERLIQAQALGHGLLHKPVQPDALRVAIDEALAKVARARRRARTRKAKPA